MIINSDKGIYVLDSPDGNEVWVAKLDNGNYRVENGIVNSDKGIYVLDSKGNKTDEKIGNSFTTHSFVDDDGSIVTGAIINPNDRSGQEFLDFEIIEDNPDIISYMLNATENKKYDFKRRDIDNIPDDQRFKYIYRGMPITDENGNSGYASARDVGNVGAGYIAGKKGLTWKLARLGFDALQSWQDKKLAVEPINTQKAERRGYEAGSRNSLVNYLLRKIFIEPTSYPGGEYE